MKSGILALALLIASGVASAQTDRPPMTCVHSDGAWDAQNSRLIVFFPSKTCDVATGSRAYSWSEADDADYGGILIAQANAMTLTTDCRRESIDNHQPCGDSEKNVIAMATHAAREKRESICSRHPDWWVVTIGSGGDFGALESCGK
jgi:hypothetical protein